MFASVVIGIAIGYLFKPQIDFIVKKIIKLAKKNMKETTETPEPSQQEPE